MCSKQDDLTYWFRDDSEPIDDPTEELWLIAGALGFRTLNEAQDWLDAWNRKHPLSQDDIDAWFGQDDSCRLSQCCQWAPVR